MRALVVCVCLVVACRVPDVVGVRTAYGESDYDTRFAERPIAFGSDGASWALMPYVEWQFGEAARHRERMDAEQRRSELALVTSGSKPAVTVQTGGDSQTEGTETSAALDKILYAVAAILLAVAGAIGLLAKRSKKDAADDT